MAKFYPELNDTLVTFIERQHIFFTGSAAASGRVNLSPKGMDSLRVLDMQHVAYLDLTGSGNETAAHILHDGRLTLMFCSFEEDPLILRLYGKGRAVRPHDQDWPGLQAKFPDLPGKRQIIELTIDSVQTSCGWAVPKFAYQSEREMMARWVEKKGKQGIIDYWREKNRSSIDGLPTGLFAEEVL